MFEARLIQGVLLKKVLDAVKDLVDQGNFDINSTGIGLQAMDSSHVSLVSLQLRSDGFEHFRCDRTMSMGMKLENVWKLLKCAGNDDIITMKAEDNGDIVTFMFESPNQDRVSEFEMKLMDIDSEHLGIPDQEYEATVQMPSSEFQRICRDLSQIGDTVQISVTKDGVSFTSTGDIGAANITCRPSSSVEKEDEKVSIQMECPVSLTFALRYLNSFSKATALSPRVCLRLSSSLPVMVEYPIDSTGYIKYFLAPKIDDEEMEGES